MANDLSAFKGEAWSKRLTDRTIQTNVMLPLVNKNWEGELQRIGDKVWIRTVGSIPMSTYTPGTPIDYTNLAPTKQAFTVSTAKKFAFQVDDIEKAQNDLSAMDEYIQPAMEGMNDEIESEIFSVYNSIHADHKVTAVGGGPIELTAETSGTSVYAQFVKARTLLRKAEVPLTNVWAVIDPDTTALLMEDTKHFIKSTELGDRVVVNGNLGIQGADGTFRPGFVGRCLGFDVYESTQLPTISEGSPAVSSKFLLFGDNQLISYANQLVEIEAVRLETQFATAVRGLILHEAIILTACSKRGVSVKAKVVV